MKRRDVKDHHERSVLDSFACVTQADGKNFKVISRPDPPDAFVDIGEDRTWIEITDAFLSGDLARSITSYSADDVAHRACGKTVVVNPVRVLEESLCCVIEKKLKNQQLDQIAKCNGMGILLVGLYSPFMDSDDISNLVKIASDCLAGNTLFKEAYLYDREHRFYKVYCTSSRLSK
ncbi:hypothetical protein ACE02G_20065 [Shewanella xiamenensis]|uniref:hypothetical protein n=1 Tax=Shewanella xiamenensis TaxID=332186 RepID=UPI0035BADE77